MTDFELLQAYVTAGEEDAFTEVVHRHLNLVYSAALRQTSDAQTAAEIAQSVFIILARKAGSIRQDTVLLGWLLRTTRYAAANARRREQYRHELEQRAMEHLYSTEGQSVWTDIAPLLDEALADLAEKDRDVIALRFFGQQSYREIGLKLACSEESARKRLTRAMDKLRALLAKRGKLVATGAMGSAISSHGVTAAPVELAGSAAKIALAKGAMATGPVPSLAQATLQSLNRLKWRAMSIRFAAVVLTGASVVLLFWSVAFSDSTQRTAHPLEAGAGGLERSSQQAPEPSRAASSSGVPASNANAGLLRLRVFDAEDGRPVENARLTLVWVTDFPNRLTNVFFTDATGESVLNIDRNPVSHWNSRIEVFRDGYVPKYVSWSESQGDAVGDIPQEYTTKLARGTQIGGLVVNDQGQPVAGARVVFNVVGQAPATSRERERLTMMGHYHTEVTDAQGRWRCNHVPFQFSMISYQVFHPDYKTASFGSAAFGATSSGGLPYVAESALRDGSATFVLNHGLVVTGVVTDETGNPIPNAKVTENRDWHEVSASQFTGNNGRFRFANLEPKEAILTVQAEGFAPKDLTLIPSAAQPELAVVLSRGGPLRGQVVEQDGTPIANAQIQLGPDSDNRNRAEWNARTDEQGSFEWSTAPTTKELYAIEASGHISAKLELTPDGGLHVIKLRKEGTAAATSFTIAGTVVDAVTMQPIEKFEVLEGTTELGTQPTGFLRSISFAPEIRTRGKAGRFSFETGGSAAAYLFEARADGYWPAEITNSGPLTADQWLDFQLRRAAAIAGVVQLPDGTPAQRAVAILCTDKADACMKLPQEFDLTRLGNAQHVETDAEGHFSFKPQLGIERIRVAHQAGYGEATLAELTASPVITLKPWGRVEGTLRIGNRAATNETVWLDTWHWRYGPFANFQLHMEAVTDAEGHFTFEGVPPGEREVCHCVSIKPGKTGPDKADRIILKSSHSTSIMLRPWYGQSQRTFVRVEPGQTAQVTLGGTGRAVIGTVRAIGFTQSIDWQRDVQSLSPKLSRAPAPKRENFESESEFTAAQSQWRAQEREFWLSEAGRNFQLNAQSYVPVFGTDGSFRIDDVIPGTYTLNIRISDPDVPNSPFDGKPLGSLEQEVTVPATESPTDQPAIDLGTLDLQPTSN